MSIPQPTSDPPPTSPPPPKTLRISTRSSALALAQTHLFTALLASHPSPALSALRTTTHSLSTSLGDTNKTTSLHALASTGKSLWTEDLEAELLAGHVDIIVHSMKDVPTKLARGCVCAAVGAREEGRDCVLVSPAMEGAGVVSLAGLEEWGGAGEGRRRGVVGTSSVRRAAMIRRLWPGLEIRDVRGNVGTRVRKLDAPGGEYDALVLAGAGVQRLGMGGRVASWVGRGEGVLHAVGQGALGVEWREGDEWVGGLVRALRVGRMERRVAWEVIAERGLLRVLEGGCSVPVGVDCVWEDVPGEERKDVDGATAGNQGYEYDDAVMESPEAGADGGILVMYGMVVSVDGKQCVEATRRQHVSCDADAEECGWQMAKELVEKGAAEVLKEITLNRGMIQGQDGA